MNLNAEQLAELEARAEAMQALEDKFREFYFERMTGIHGLRRDIRALLKKKRQA